MLEGVIAPHLQPRAPRDYGTGRICWCGTKINRYTSPQPITGIPLCNRHWTLPAGWTYGSRGLVRTRKEPLGA